MLQEKVVHCSLPFPKENLYRSTKITTRDITTRLLKEVATEKVSKHGYILAVTKVISIGIPELEFFRSYVSFPVAFRVRVFLPVSGEIFTGTVHRINRLGVFLKSGPMRMVYISYRKMPNYEYVPGKKPAFVREDLSRIEIGVVVRYRVFAVRWSEDHPRDFRVLASIDEDDLGPVSTLSGLDELEF